jgi:putative tryptophan/tyrosine transport system substrate-binding protein
MRRRDFITLIGGAAITWPAVGLAQQQVMPVVGVLYAGTAQAVERYLASFREGMRQLGYVEGGNVRFELRLSKQRPRLCARRADDPLIARDSPNHYLSVPQPR